MGIFDNTNVTAMPSTQAAGRNAAQQKPPAKLWLNVGYEVPSKDENGNDIMRFISVPVGIPIDTMEPKQVRGSGDFANTISAGNSLLKQLQDGGDQLEPGEERAVHLVVKLRKVKEEANISDSDNPLAMDVSKLFG